MTGRLATVCNVPTCPAIAVKDGRCAVHKRKPWATTRPYPKGRAWELVRARIFERDGHRCSYCGGTGELVIDHVLARAFGGSDADSNLVAACRACNEARRKQQARGRQYAKG